MRRCIVIIPAAGLSRRMGQPKLLLEIDGQTVMSRLINVLLGASTVIDSGDAITIIIVGRRHDEALWNVIQPDDERVIAVCPEVDPPDMRASINQALLVARQQLQPTDDDLWMLIPADHPVLDRQVIHDVLQAATQYPQQIVIPVYQGERGHPTAIPWKWVDEVLNWPSDLGLNAWIRSCPERVHEFELQNPAVTWDLDTPEDLARIREFTRSQAQPVAARASGPCATASNIEKRTDSKSMRQPRIGGIIVCGGKSTRMGQPKLSLPFGDELMLQRMCRILAEVVDPIVVVAAHGQDLPLLPTAIRVIRDEYEDQGPLAGIATGLGALRSDVDAAFVTSCDVPLLKPEWIRELISRLGDHSAVVPVDGEHAHVLAAVYRVELETVARQLLAQCRRRPLFLVEEAKASRVPTDELRIVDPQLDSLRNLNTPREYAEALGAVPK